VKILPAKSPEYQRTDEVVNNSANSIDEYNNLKVKLLVVTLLFAIAISLAVWFVYGTNTALNYLLGACVGVVYLRMLARGVDRLDPQNRRLGYTRFAVFVILIVIASRLKQLQILPAFLGFITYKASLLVILAQDLTREFRSPKI